jgi:hypothetical protein
MQGRGAAIAAATLVLAGCGTPGQTAARTVTVTSTLQPVITQTVTYTPPPPPGPKTTISTDGTYQVGVDIVPGTYRTTGGSGCYWARLRSLSTNDIIDNNNASGPVVVEILPSDAAFLTERCGTWQRSS